jgi:hypothetical protein
VDLEQPRLPGIDTLNVRGDKVRIRIGNLTMTNHPIHLHGHEFVVTGTDGGPTPKSAARWPEVTTDVAVGQMRQIEFDRRRGGRLGLPLPQEPPHHERHGPRRAHHDRRGPPRPGEARSEGDPDYMVMGERGMADMGEMEMPLPDNTVPMMTGKGPSARWRWAACSPCSRCAGPEAGRLQGPGLVQAAGRPAEMVIGTKQELDEHAALMAKFPNMEHDEPYMAHVARAASGARCSGISTGLASSTLPA